MRYILAFVLSVGLAALAAAEPSAFRAGNVNGGGAYGLTEAEKTIRANKQTIDRLEKRVFALEQQIERLSELVEGMSATNKSNGEAIVALRRSATSLEELAKQITDAEAKNKKQLDGLGTRQDSLEKQVNKALTDQAKNQEKLAKAIESSASKAQLERAVKVLSGVAPNFDNEQPDAVLSEARKLIEAKDYDGAYDRVSYLIGKQHKTAESTFYLGTIYYFQEDNEKALDAFKSSANLDSAAKYMPVLFYYSGICHERLKNNADARKFYETLIKLYPDHNTIEGAKKRLAKLPQT
ncbi:MAG: tetratricopeptide repeat protein [Helicobacteraceae bacterium]|jgi:TolA-binding protein|nr:tetratricopeptide repeat protein [Helicobacteraceae bacterium]